MYLGLKDEEQFTDKAGQTYSSVYATVRHVDIDGDAKTVTMDVNIYVSLAMKEAGKQPIQTDRVQIADEIVFDEYFSDALLAENSIYVLAKNYILSLPAYADLETK